MCGITLTTCTKLIKTNSRLNPITFQKILENKKSDENIINKLYKLSFDYKSDINFINYFKSKNERIKIKNFLKKVKKKFSKETNEKNLEKLKDIEWFLGEELLQRYKFVKKFALKKNNMRHSLVFFKVLHSVINSINLLEIRGRDSLGIFFNITLEKNEKNLKIVKNLNPNGKYSYKITTKKIILNVVYKTFNIIGSLGENSNKLLHQFKRDKSIINLFLQGNFETVTIIAHTRWASVGKVNLENTHPVIKNKIFSFMNGDIQNYKNFIKSKNKKNKESDAFALCNIFNSQKDFKNKLKTKKLIHQTKGSFAGVVFLENDISEILLIRKGSMGLFNGKNSDRIFFSSDIYGLVEDCQKSIECKKDSFSTLKISVDNTKLKNFSLQKKNNKSFLYNRYENNVITRRDLVKKNYKYYLEKEINESSDIVKKTIINYLESKSTQNKTNLFNETKFTNIKNIVSKIKNKTVNKIYLVGMGTCHTAAETIAGYMKNKFSFNGDLEVSALVSSEASAFHLKKNMKNTLVIAIAQSGTTKDTNIFVEMAKKRGASTLCLLNKRNGDISYICESTLYLGNGRDIEISVPSTKTYVAHIVLGYILTNYLLKKTINFNFKNKIIIKKEIKEIKKIPNFINKTIKNFNKFNKKINYKKIIKTKNWYVVYDNNESYYAGSEIRIKLSECCYKTLPCIYINDLNANKIKNSIIILIKDRLDRQNNKKIEDIIKNNSLTLIISQNIKLKKNLKCINIINPVSFKKFNIIPSVINGQLLSFNIAKELNKRSLIFSKILKKNSFYKLKNKDFIDSIFENINKKEIIKLRKNIKKFSKVNKKLNIKSKNNLIYFEQQMRRPIDTIKHQAKTITVGTERKLSTHSIKKIKHQVIRHNRFNKISLKKNFEKIDILNEKKYLNINLKDINTKDPLINFVYSYFLYLKNKINSLPKIYLNKENQNKSNSLNIELIKNLNLVSEISISNNRKNVKLKIKDNNKFFNFKKKNLYLTNVMNLFEDLNLIVFNLIKKSQSKKFIKILNKLYSQIYHCMSFYDQNNFSTKINKIKKMLISKHNIKFIGGGNNFFINSYLSNLMNQNLLKSSGFDILENHKHIDMSAEPFLFTLITNCPDLGYFSDFISETEKFISHNNLPVIITDKYDIKKFKNSNLNRINVLNVPENQKEISFIIYLKLFENLYLNN